MVTQVSLGNFFNSGGKTVLAGSASGLDVESLIKTMTEARGIPAKKLQDKIDINDKRSEAYGTLKGLLDRFRDAANFLRNPPGVANATDNVFKYRNATVASNSTVDGENYLTVSAAPGAAVQSYLITEITSIAKATKQATANLGVATTTESAVTAGVSAGFFKAGTISINGEDVTLTAGDSLQTVVAKFNAVKDETGITASIVQVDSTNFRVLWTANETGLDAAFDLNATADPDQVLDGLGVIGNQQTASNAQFIIDGITITRQSNTISDVIDDVTFTLKQVMNDGTTEVTADIAADTIVAKNGIINMINAYNDLKIFAAKQTKIDTTGAFSKDSVLSSSTLLRNILGTVGGHISSLVDGVSGSNPSRLADLGITFADLPEGDDNPYTRNILNLNEEKLDSLLAGNFDAVRKVFEFDSSFNNSNFTVFSRGNNTSATSVDLTITPGSNTFQATINSTVYNLTATAISGGGYRLEGPEGSPIEGLVVIYGASDPITTTLTMTQGIADRLWNTMNGVLQDQTGTLAIEMDSISDSNDRLTSEIDRINAQVDRYREQLLDQFGRLDAAISSVNTLLTALDAQSKARQQG